MAPISVVGATRAAESLLGPATVPDGLESHREREQRRKLF